MRLGFIEAVIELDMARPASHSVHEADPTASAYFPEAQPLHVLSCVCRVAALLFPFSQSLQDESPTCSLYLPGSQGVQAPDCAAFEKVPASQRLMQKQKFEYEQLLAPLN